MISVGGKKYYTLEEMPDHINRMTRDIENLLSRAKAIT